MPRPLRRPAPLPEWAQELIDADCDARWRAALDPLSEQFQRWKAGELTHDDLDRAIHRTHRQGQQIDDFLTQRRADLVAFIRWGRDCFGPWVAAHPSPPDVGLIAPPPALAPGPDRSLGSFENRSGEQAVFVCERGHPTATLSLGDLDWQPRAVVVGRAPDIVLEPTEQRWLRACWRASAWLWPAD